MQAILNLNLLLLEAEGLGVEAEEVDADLHTIQMAIHLLLEGDVNHVVVPDVVPDVAPVVAPVVAPDVAAKHSSILGRSLGK